MITPRFILYLALILFTLIYGLVKLKTLHPAYRLLVLLIGTTVLSEITSRILAYTIKNSSPAYYVFTSVELILLCLVLYRLVNQKLVLIIGLLAFLLDAGLVIRDPDFTQFPSQLLMVNSAAIIVLSLYCIYYFLNVRSTLSLFKQSWFWLNIGNLIFFTSTFLFFSLINYILKDQHVPEILYSGVWFMAIIQYTCYFAALYTNANYQTPIMERQ